MDVRAGYKEGWAPKNDAFELQCWRRFLTVLWHQGPNQSILKEISPEYFIGRTDAEAPILWPPDTNSQLIAREPDARKDWGQEEKKATKDEMAGWHHWLSGHESEQILGDSEGQGSLVCCSPWGSKGLDKTEQQILPVKSCDSRHYGKFQVWEGPRLSGTENMMVS